MAYTKQSWTNGSGGGTPLSATRLNYMESGIESASLPADSAPHVVRWNGSAWRYRGATVTARPAVAAWPDADVWWDTTQDSTYSTPPPLAVTGDKWMPHGDVVPSV